VTNQELYQEIKELRQEGRKDREVLLKHIHSLEKELTLFKGKSFGFMVALSLVFTVITNVGIALITKGD